nr:acyltransferase family protein [Neobacillus sp. Marseille-Q6967]
MISPMQEKRRYMPGLDGLRAIAVIGVILYHLNIPWFSGGFLGVTVFFVLSGYLITDLLIDEWNKTQKIDLIRFVIRRFRRLAPALLFMLFLVTAWVTFTDHPAFEKLQDELIPSIFYMMNWYYIFHEYSYFDSFGPVSPLTHIWSLAIEEQFYLIWPLLMILVLKIIKTRYRVFLIFVGIIASSWLMAFLYTPGEDPSRVYYGTDTRAFSLLLGAALAFVWPSQTLSAAITRPARLVLESIGGAGLALIVILFIVTSQFEDFLYQGGMMFLSILTVLVVATLAHPASTLTKWLNIPPIRWIGVRSYGIYLWHYPIIVLTNPAVNTDGVNLGRMALQLTTTLVLSALSYKFVEVPIRAGRLKINPSNLKSLTLLQKSILLGSCLLCIGVAAAFTTNASTTALTIKTPIAAEPLGRIEFGQKEEAPNIPEPETKRITIIGDSILYDVIPFFTDVYPEAVFDYRVGRQMTELPDVIKRLEEEGKLGDYVIIQIGTNGPFKKSDLTQVIEGLGQRKVFLVNCRVPRPWENTVNRTLEEIVQSLPNTVLVDWYSTSAGHAEYFVSDGVHLTRLGGETYANLLFNFLRD